MTLMKNMYMSKKMSPKYCVQINRQGRIVIPAAIRREIGIEPDQKLNVRVEKGRIVLESTRAAAERLRGCMKTPRGESLVDSLIEERRKEARAE